MAGSSGIPVSALTQKVLTSLGQESRNTQADAELVGNLKQAASRGDHEAVELLGNLALGITPDRQSIAKLATQALLKLSTDPEVSDAIRYSIREFSLDVVTSECDWSRSEKSGKSRERAFLIPTPLLSLALPEVQKKNYDTVKQYLQTTLYARLEGIGDSGEMLVSPTRFCTFEEIFNTFDARLEISKSESGALSLERMPLMADQFHFGESFKRLAEEAVKSKKCHAAVIKDGGHWVVAVVGPASNQTGKLDIVVYDTFHGTDAAQAKQLTAKIKQALDSNLLGSFTYAGQNVQGNTNGCAPLCTRALRGLRERLAEKSGQASMKTVKEFLQSDLAVVSSWSQETLDGIVAGLRAEMLEATEAALKQNFGAQCHDQPDRAEGTAKKRKRMAKKRLSARAENLDVNAKNLNRTSLTLDQRAVRIHMPRNSANTRTIETSSGK